MRGPGALAIAVIVGAAICGNPTWAASPERPRAFVDTSVPAPTGRAIAVAAGGNVQAALDAAQPGDVVTLAAGATFRGAFTLPKKPGAGWITLRTSAPDTSLPPGVRVGPGAAALMPKLVIDAGTSIRTAPGAHHFRLVGLEIRPAPGAFVHNLVELGTYNATSAAAQAHDVVVERCYIHGDPTRGGRRGIALNGRSIAVIDSHVADFKEVGADSQALMGWNGPGPFKIVNNYLEAAGENVMFGGADPAIRDLVPSDIEIRGNHFSKPRAWRRGDPGYTGTTWSVKNLFELKNARRVLIEGNVFEHLWLADQAGFAIQLTVRNQDGGAPWSTIEDVTFVRNVVRHVGSGINILGSDDPKPSGTMQRVLIQDNLFDDVSGARWGGQGRLFQVLDYRAGTSDIVIEHNTGFQDGPPIFADGVAHHGFVYRNNLTPKGDYGVFGSGVGEGLPALTKYFPDAVFAKNVIVGGTPTVYPPNNFFPKSLEAVGFVDLAARNYRLSPRSPYKNAGTDGRDVGADIDALSRLGTVTSGRH